MQVLHPSTQREMKQTHSAQEESTAGTERWFSDAVLVPNDSDHNGTSLMVYFQAQLRVLTIPLPVPVFRPLKQLSPFMAWYCSFPCC